MLKSHEFHSVHTSLVAQQSLDRSTSVSSCTCCLIAAMVSVLSKTLLENTQKCGSERHKNISA